MRKNYLTLPEFLAILAIIIILAGLLLPALSQAKKKAKAIEQQNKINTSNAAEALYKIDAGGDIFYCDDYEASSTRVKMWTGYSRLHFAGEIILDTAKKIKIIPNPDMKQKEYARD